MVLSYKRWRKVPSLRKVTPKQLEQLCYSIPSVSDDIKEVQADLLWCDPAIRQYVASLYQKEEMAHVKGLPKEAALHALLKEDMVIIRDQFPKIRSLDMELICHEDGILLRDHEGDIWETFKGKFFQWNCGFVYFRIKPKKLKLFSKLEDFFNKNSSPN